jgi:hypothetical protein
MSGKKPVDFVFHQQKDNIIWNFIRSNFKIMKSVILKKLKENPSAKVPRHSEEQDVFLYTKTILPSASGCRFAAELAPLF